MAQFQGEEFKFPDEIDQETKGKPDVEVEASEGFSVEIEDDRPPEDRKAEPPLSKEEVEDLEKDNHEEYSKRVKDRIDKMKKAWHDERRAKEAADREREEAIRVAQQMIEENKKLKATLSKGEKQFVNTVQDAAKAELKLAKRNYQEALDGGDSEAIAKALVNLNEASYKVQEAKNFKPKVKIKDKDIAELDKMAGQMSAPAQQSAQPAMDPLTTKWLEKNTWYGPDEEMTALALGTHAKLEKQFGKGYIGSEDYFKRIDDTMRKRFPENFSDEEVEVQTQAGGDKPSSRAEVRSAPVVAPATRSTAAKKIVLKATQVALAKKLGLTPEQYAREMQKLEA
jgi:hypothetical protein